MTAGKNATKINVEKMCCARSKNARIRQSLAAQALTKENDESLGCILHCEKTMQFRFVWKFWKSPNNQNENEDENAVINWWIMKNRNTKFKTKSNNTIRKEKMKLRSAWSNILNCLDFKLQFVRFIVDNGPCTFSWALGEQYVLDFRSYLTSLDKWLIKDFNLNR